MLVICMRSNVAPSLHRTCPMTKLFGCPGVESCKDITTTIMKIASLGLAGGRWYDRTNSLRTPTMQESQLVREKTTSSVFLSTCSNAVHAQFH